MSVPTKLFPPRQMHCFVALLIANLMLCTPVVAQGPEAEGTPPLQAFPGALGWASETPGGRNGQLIRVTNLNSDGPGSLRAALSRKGPRTVVFEVGGVIDLSRQTLVVTEPFVTIAGQTAPSPGVTIIRAGIDIRTHDVIVRHLRVRPGSAGMGRGSGWGEDAISTVSAFNVIVDHCSLTWATDENLSASGPRFTGDTVDQWRAGTSHRITFSHNIIGEGLADSSHPKFEHSKGSLIHDNVTELLIYGNLYAHNFERNPHFKGGVHGLIVNNLIYDPGQRAVHYNLQSLEWGNETPLNGQMTAVGNVLRAGPSTLEPLPFLMLGGDGDLDFHGADNIAVDRLGAPMPDFGRYTTSRARLVEHDAPLDWHDSVVAIEAADVQAWVLANAGARPWDRDHHDVRLLANVAEGRGQIIDNEAEVGGYPDYEPSHRPFNPDEWNLETMEPLNPETLDGARKSGGT